MLAFLDKIPMATPRVRRVAFGLLCALLAYVLAGFLLLPAIIKSTVVSQGAAALGRPIHLGEIAFNPLTLRLTLREFRVDAHPNAPDDEEPLLSFDEMSARADLASLWHMAPVINDLTLRELAVSVTRYDDGRYSISDLLHADSETDTARGREEAPFPFALYGFEMSNATIVFDDQPRNKRHVISEINLNIPFTSSFEALRGEFTQPSCSAVVNGDPVTLEGRTLPFHDSLHTEFHLGAVDVDLSEYWPYAPADTPLSLVHGRFSSDLSLNFERPDARRINLFISGGGNLTDLEIASPQDGKVLSARQISFRLERFSPSDMRLALSELSVDNPALRVIRRDDGSINWEQYFPAQENKEEDSRGSAQDKAIQAVIRSLTVTSGSVEWIDRAIPGGFSCAMADLSVTARDVNTGTTPVPFAATSTITPATQDGAKAPATITANGQLVVSPLSASATVTAAGIALADYAPYYAQALPLVVESATLGASGTVTFEDKQSPSLSLRNGALTLTDLRLRIPDSETPTVSAQRLTVDGVSLSSDEGAVVIAEILLQGPHVWLRMEEPGRVDLVDLFARHDRAAPGPEPAPQKGLTSAAEPDWTARVDSLRLSRGNITLVDTTTAPASGRATSFSLSDMDLEARNISTRHHTPNDSESMPLTCDLKAVWGGGGTIGLKAEGFLAPLSASGAVTLSNVGLIPVNPLLSQFADVALTRGAATSSMAVGLEEGRLTLRGNLSVTDASLAELSPTSAQSTELVGFDALGLTGILFESEPAGLAVEAIRLTGPRGRVEFDEKGRVNLLSALRIAQPDPEGDTAPAAAPDNATEPEPAVPEQEPGQDEPGFLQTLRVGTVSVEQGTVLFRDASVAPTYSTKVEDIRLTLTDIARSDDSRPEMDMRASLGQTPLSATGIINPAVVPLYTDIAVSLGGLELAPLTPYTLKYLGHPVEHGSLYAEVIFKTENNMLEADNSFLVRQLVLGPKDTRPDVPNVPVRFGLSLLQDANGDVRIDLPIRGRLDDPNFRLNGIVFKAVAGLFTRALTSPFSIIGSLFGGTATNMDSLVFEPGSSELGASALHKLDTVATALEARPRLTLEVVGVTDPQADRKALTDILLNQRLKERKLRSLPPSQRAWTTVEAMTIEPDEYEDLLYEAYKAEPDKTGTRPTTFFVADRQPPEVMRKFLKDAIAVSEDDLHQLERRRAEAVRLHLVERDPALERRVALPDRRGPRTARTGVPLHRADLGLR
ncbi:DUF748 domain-containing protein [Pseudodesulfovibrio sp. F-1]|uniref:DUF748 domain-containing protein n=1 Tax=Pseudodesulfovibrio alkaliphilus TaxID=2661613 RepID=A0A7K1KRD0_9BACT|nr:DUF748 domain-containing protein [Pseudodesulfovibrio alkaliphilus]MUM78656.1 DUF748 domain-containing protein [Pseudodesulfovibrio alkaliphilus]